MAEQDNRGRPRGSLERALDEWFIANVGCLNARGDTRYDALLDAYVTLRSRLAQDPDCLALGERGPGGLIWKVANDCERSAWRRRARELGLESWEDGGLERALPDHRQSPDSVVDAVLIRERLRELSSAMRQLHDRARLASGRVAAVAERRLAGCDYAEVASELGITQAAARQRWSRFRATLPEDLWELTTRLDL